MDSSGDEGAKYGFESGEPSDLTRDRWLQAQRDLVTTTLDYNLQTITQLVAEERIDLSPMFQRRERWDLVRRSQLIESFMMNVPMPPVFLNEDEYGKYSVIDGKQRMTAVADFMQNKFALDGLTVFSEANGARFRDLDPSLQAVLETRASLRAIIILRMSDPLIKYHVFQRLNTGGVRLNTQEVRNVVFAGALNNTLVKLSAYPTLQELLKIHPNRPESSYLWREMRDVELVLRFFTIRDSMNYRGSLGAAMNQFMQANMDMTHGDLAVMADGFERTVELTYLSFGETSFRRWSPKTRKWGNQPLATLFDAQMQACLGRSPKQLTANAESIRLAMGQLFLDPEFTRSIGSATNTASFMRYRIGRVSEILDRYAPR